MSHAHSFELAPPPPRLALPASVRGLAALATVIGLGALAWLFNTGALARAWSA